MRVPILRFILIFLMMASIFIPGWSQTPGGSIRGEVTDPAGFPLPGASLYLRSDKILGMKTFITSDTGKFHFRPLLPGDYRLTVEMPGFKTIRVDDIQIHAGRIIRLRIVMEMTTIEEEISRNIPVPAIEGEASKTASIIDQHILLRIPFRRDLHEVLSSVAGVFPEEIAFPQASVINGSSESYSMYITDGFFMTDPLISISTPGLNFDVAHEIEVETAGHPAEVQSVEAGYINVVTKSAGPNFDGELLFHFTSEGLGSQLTPNEDLNEMNIAPPSVDKSLLDISFSMAGTLWPDLIRFFANVHYVNNTRTTPFTLWTDPSGIEHNEYEWKNTQKLGFFRLTGRISPRIKFIGTFTYGNRKYPAYNPASAARLTQDASSMFSPGQNMLITGKMDYVLNQNTFLDINVSYYKSTSELILNEYGAESPQFWDEATEYRWGSGALNSIQGVDRIQASAAFILFNDRIMGMEHRFKLGFEYESVASEWNSWKQDNLLIHYNNNSPYYFGMVEHPVTQDLVGLGKISFSLLSERQDDFFNAIDTNRIGVFAQDSIKLSNRLTLNLGLRFDRIMSTVKETVKGASGNPTSIELGLTYIAPVANFNPYAASGFSSWKDIITWNTFSPRIGMTFDIFGNGRTILKASFSRYPEYNRMADTIAIYPLNFGRSHYFYWYDDNMDGQVSSEDDSFLPFNEDYRFYDGKYTRELVADDLKSPYLDEYTVGLWRELFQGISFGFNYIQKTKKNMMEDALFSLDDNQEWYTISKDTQGWWVPFDTVVPGADDYEDIPVTLFYSSKDAPALFYRTQNVPELKRTYQAFELVLHKRMSNNWQLHGSIVFSKSKGNIGVGSQFRHAFSPAANSPNYFVNLSDISPNDFDIPLAIKLMGTYRFPYDFYVSFFFNHRKGFIWARSVTVIPAADWAQAENVDPIPTLVLLEDPGTRRHNSYSNLNLRIEKELHLQRFGALGLAMDVFNVFGNEYQLINQNDGGFWLPADQNGTQGERIFSPTYQQGIDLNGIRQFRFTLRLRF